MQPTRRSDEIAVDADSVVVRLAVGDIIDATVAELLPDEGLVCLGLRGVRVWARVSSSCAELTPGRSYAFVVGESGGGIALSRVPQPRPAAGNSLDLLV